MSEERDYVNQILESMRGRLPENALGLPEGMGTAEFWKSGSIESKQERGGIAEPKMSAAVEACYRDLVCSSEEWGSCSPEGIFSWFFGFFGKVALLYGERFDLSELKDWKEAVLSNLYPALVWIPMRVLIADIHSQKEQGALFGEDSREEYEDYQRRFLSDRWYIETLCRRYPEMKRLLCLKIEAVVRQIRQICRSAREDFPGHKLETVVCGLSDAQKGGLTEARVCFDDQSVYYYKPRDLKKEKWFREFYGEFCREAGVPLKEILILCRKEYGWQGEAKQENCIDEAGVRRYFQRMGVLLFLCYLLGISDMYGKNIVASGEYPIPVHLETLTWGTGGEKALLSALHREETVKAPFRLPVLIHAKSSEITIACRKGERRLTGSLPKYENRAADVSGYAQEVREGFARAYRFFLKRREVLLEEIKPLFLEKTEYLMRNTQKYQLYLRASFYPELLEDGNKRRLFLHILSMRQKAGEPKDEKQAAAERDSLFQMELPVLYQKADWESFFGRQERLCERDLEEQEEGILELLKGT